MGAYFNYYKSLLGIETFKIGGKIVEFDEFQLLQIPIRDWNGLIAAGNMDSFAFQLLQIPIRDWNSYFTNWNWYYAFQLLQIPIRDWNSRN